MSSSLRAGLLAVIAGLLMAALFESVLVMARGRDGGSVIIAVDALMWIGVLASAWWRRHALARSSRRGLMLLLAAHAAVLAVGVVRSDPVTAHPPFELSREYNTVQIIVGGVQGDRFWAEFTELGLEERFQGFVAFPDTITPSSEPVRAVLASLSGRRLPMIEDHRSYELLRQQGTLVDLFSPLALSTGDGIRLVAPTRGSPGSPLLDRLPRLVVQLARPSDPSLHELALLRAWREGVSTVEGPARYVLFDVRAVPRAQVVGELLALLDRLSELGVYDSTTIVVHSDVGEDLSSASRDLPSDLTPEQLGASSVLLAVKLPHASGPLSYSRLLASTTDVPRTILAAVGIDGDLPGHDLALSLADGAPRERWFDDWVVTGPLADGAGWQRGGRRGPPARRALGLRDRVDFAVVGSGARYLGNGWNPAEDEGTWSGGSAELSLPFDPSLQRSVLKLVIVGRVYDPPQRLAIFVDGRAVVQEVVHDAYVRLEVPVRVRNAATQLRFELPDAHSPASIGASVDDRDLGLMLYGIAVRADEAFARQALADGTPLRAGDRVDFTVLGTGSRYRGAGWSPAEREGSWAMGPAAQLEIPVALDGAEGIMLEIRGRVFDPPQRIVVSVDGEVAADQVFTEPAARFEAPLSRDGSTVVQFSLPDAHSPASLGTGSSDERSLGLMVHTLALHPPRP